MAKKQASRKPNVKKPVVKAAAIKQKEALSSYNKWITGCSYAILVVVPLLFSRISYDQFDLVKLAALRVLVFKTDPVPVTVFRAARGWTRPSDHVPVTATIEM